jgi:GNAT superfamily N-acetyltransferase
VTDAIVIRSALRPGDLGAIVEMHGRLYASESGFDATFEAYVAGALATFALKGSPRERIWLAERGARLAGCVAIVEASHEVAQLRWFLVDPASRGHGLGSALLSQAVDFCVTSGFRSIVLWTVASLAAAARLSRGAGFRLVEQVPGRRWGTDVVEERYERTLRP